MVAADEPRKSKPADKKPAAKKPAAKKPAVKKVVDSVEGEKKRTRTQRPYPVVSYRDATVIGDAIFKYASGEKVRRLTLLEKMGRNPTSSTTQKLITNSGKYDITTGSYAAEWLELTPLGRQACDPDGFPRSRLEAQFKLAIEGVEPFKALYEAYIGRKLPVHEVMKDKLLDTGIEVDDPKECIDLFVVNAKDLGLLRMIASAETLVPIEQVLDGLAAGSESVVKIAGSPIPAVDKAEVKKAGATKWETTCFYVSPIGEPGSEPRRHSDLFLSQLVEPALKELGLSVVRADHIAEPGMITTHVIEHLRRCKLVVADLSLLNPNVFYEMALRHAVRLPILQIIRKADRLPFDVNQVNSIIIDNTDIYSLIPQIETYRSQIAALARSAIEDPEHVGNPIASFYPDFWKEPAK
jgi:hypothetical protein